MTRSDDWGRSESYAEINCPACSKTLRIESTGGHDKGIPTTHYKLVAIKK